MRKLWRTVLAAGLMILMACLFAGINVFAEKAGGELCEGFTWSFDSDTGTLTLTGEGKCPFAPTRPDFQAGGYWFPYAEQIQEVYLDGITAMRVDYSMEYAKTLSGRMYGQVNWRLDRETMNLEITGKGDVLDSPWYPLTSYATLNQVTLGEEITSWMGGDTNILAVGKSCRYTSAMTANVWNTFLVDPENPYLSSYESNLYTKDFRELLYCPKKQTELTLHPNVRTIKQDSICCYFDSNATLVLPWGLETIEDVAIFALNGVNIILPDTVTTMTRNAIGGNGSCFQVTASQNNTLARQVWENQEDFLWHTVLHSVDSLAQYYPDVPEAQGPGPSSTPTESKPESSAPASQPESKPESKPESSAPASSTPASQPASKPTESAASSQPPESRPAPESSAPTQNSESVPEPESSGVPEKEPSTEESAIAESSQEESAAESSGESSESVESSEQELPSLPTVEKEVGGKALWIALAAVVIAAGGAAAVLLKKGKK